MSATTKEVVANIMRAVNTILMGFCTFFLIQFYNDYKENEKTVTDLQLKYAVEQTIQQLLLKNMDGHSMDIRQLQQQVYSIMRQRQEDLQEK